MASSSKQTQIVVLSLTSAALASLLLWYYTKSQQKAIEDGKDKQKTGKSSSRSVPSTPLRKGTKTSSESRTPVSQARTPLVSNTTSKEDDKQLHLKIEELDKKGKALFKNKQYLEAAHMFTEALDLIADNNNDDIDTTTTTTTKSSINLKKQIITLTNNRSAMYEKGGLPDLALEDCNAILDLDMKHTRARTRKLRLLESLKRYNEALVEMCALELQFLQEHREQLRMGLPVTPPVPHAKLEEFLGHVLPGEVDVYVERAAQKKDKGLPSKHTILQLLQSFTGYHSWMAQAAKEGGVSDLTKRLEACEKDAERASLLWKRGRRHVYDRHYDLARADFEAAYALVEKEDPDVLPDDEYARLLEWTGMVRHWSYNLDSATKCYERCSDLEPTNVAILVKQAGVKMDAGKQDEAMALFDTALGLDPDAVDALLHRANLYMVQQKVPQAMEDLQQCLKLRPNHLLAQLRLATVLMATNDLKGAQAALDAAERIDPKSSEVHSYRGEMHFAKGEFAEARAEFDKAIANDPTNPAPYANAALAILNTPSPSGGLPDTAEALRLLEKATTVDPQFHSAYVHLGQLRLSMATDLDAARDVVKLYDRGLENCRTPEEFKDICGMRILTVAQIEAATMLKMETFSMQ